MKASMEFKQTTSRLEQRLLTPTILPPVQQSNFELAEGTKAWYLQDLDTGQLSHQVWPDRAG